MENSSIIEEQAADPSTQTPFVIYDSGTPCWIANTIYASAELAIATFAKPSAEDAFAELGVLTRAVPYRLHDADATAIWMSYFELFLTREGDDTPSLAARLDMLRCMAQRPPDKAWGFLREYILRNADALSGWNASHVRVLSERDQIFMGNDGLYYRHGEDGNLYQVVGAKTLHETRLDFVTDQLLRNYGNL
jgi:hypothetical protein